MHSRSGFTLIELLIVIAIIAVLAIVVVLTLNPAQLLMQGRDSNRVSDLATINSALSLFLTDQPGGSLGTSNTVYVSIPDPTATSTAGDQCQGLSLPTLPAIYTYHCAASSTFRNANGMGWIPVNFSQNSYGSPLGQLPQDPINQSSSRLYYTYTTNGTQYEMTTAMESQKYRLGGSNDVVSGDGSSLSTVYTKGTNLSLEPLDYGDSSLVGYWPLNEGTGTIAYDDSGSNATGNWNGTQAGTNGYYSAGKIGTWSGYFNGSNNYIVVTSSGPAPNNKTFTAWINVATTSARNWIIGTRSGTFGGFFIENSAGLCYMDDTSSEVCLPSPTVSPNMWHFVSVAISGSNVTFYLDTNSATEVDSNSMSMTGTLRLGLRGDGNGPITGLSADLRIYNRALSAVEIQAIYNGGK